MNESWFPNDKIIMNIINKVALILSSVGLGLMFFVASTNGQDCGVTGKPDCPKTPVKVAVVIKDTPEEAAARRRKEKARLLARLAESNRRRGIMLQGLPKTGQALAAKYLKAGKAEDDKKDYIEAIEFYTKAIKVNENFSEAYYCRALSRSANNEIDAAIDDYTKAIEIDSKYTEAYNNRGKLNYDRMNIEAAIKDFSLAVTFFPYDVSISTIYTNRGKAYQFIGNTEASIDDYNKAIEADSHFIKAYLQRALVYYGQKNYTAAIADYDQVLEFENNNSEALTLKQKVQKEQRESKEKIDKLTGAVQQTTDEKLKSEKYFALGNAYLENYDFGNAITNYDLAISLNREYVFAYFNRGIAYTESKQFDAAIESFDQAISRKPDFADAYCKRGFASYGKGNFDAAINDYSKSIELSAKIPAAYFRRALAHIEKKTDEGYEAAIRDLSIYIGYDKSFAAAYLQRAAVYDLMSERAVGDEKNRLKLLADADRKKRQEFSK